MNTAVKWILLTLLIMLIAAIVPGITVSGFLSAAFVVAIMGLVNLLIRPMAEFISMPLNFLTLGLFSLIVNALLFLLVAKLSPGFSIDGFWSGFTGAFILSVFAPIIDKIDIRRNLA